MSAPVLTMGESMTGEQTRHDAEPTYAEAAELVRQVMGAGVVGRLDLIHAALHAAFRAGQASERNAHAAATRERAAAFTAEAHRLAEAHAAAFLQQLAERGQTEAERDSQSWLLQ